MVKISNKPIIIHNKLVCKHGFNDFYIALGYKGNVIRQYFKNKKKNCKINLVDTGLNTMTGVLKNLKFLVKMIFMTYGDE